MSAHFSSPLYHVQIIGKCRAKTAGKSIQASSVKAGMSSSTLAPFALHYVHQWALLKSHHQRAPPHTGDREKTQVTA